MTTELYNTLESKLLTLWLSLHLIGPMTPLVLVLAFPPNACDGSARRMIMPNQLT